MHITWIHKTFSALTPYELYEILQLRINVFMLEQQCLYPECDDKDLEAEHLFGTYEGKIIAYSRLLQPGITYTDCCIGRVVTDASYRKSGLGKALMAQAIARMDELFDEPEIRISAQAHLQFFYESVGFQKVSDPYLEDNIPHIEMLRVPKKIEG